MNQRIGYRDAVRRQVESLSDVYATVSKGLEALDLSSFREKSIGFAGIGASYQAALAGASYLRDRGIASYAYCPTELYAAIDTAAQAFVALSASGQSREIADVISRRPHLPAIALCRSPDTPLADITRLQLPFNSGSDNGASSTGYTGMLVAIGMLADKLTGKDDSTAWRTLPDLVARLLDDTADDALRGADLLANRASIDIVGAGVAFATAGEAAMLIREAVRVPAAGWDTLNYLHGPMESQDSRTGLIALGNGREIKIAADVADFGCPSVLVTSNADIRNGDNLVVLRVPDAGNEIVSAVLDIIAVQMIVADMQDAAALTNITFRYRQTDTKLKPWSPTEV